MGGNKALCIIGGIMSAVTVYLLIWFKIGTIELNGLNAIFGFMGLIGQWDLDGILLLVFTILILAAPAFILIGLATRPLAIIGGLVLTIFGVFIMLDDFAIVLPLPINLLDYLKGFYGSFSLFDPFIPFYYTLPVIGFSLGTILFLAGGVLGFIGGCA